MLPSLALLLIWTTHGVSVSVYCTRPKGWCSHGGATSALIDCDGDGIADPVCSDTAGGFGYVGLSQGCRGEWPNVKCSSQKGQVCSRSGGWCSGGGATFLYQDCDNDGIPDPVCSHTNGAFGIIKSSQHCKSTWPQAMCKAYGSKGYTCARSNGWCSHRGSTFALLDCDGDGTPDPICSDTAGSFGFIASKSGCHSNWPKARCQTKKGRVCSRPTGWCSHGGSTFMYKDCDADGIPDPVCTDTNGSFGVVKSGSGCASEWPRAICRQK